jgi:hypothetical protein
MRVFLGKEHMNIEDIILLVKPITKVGDPELSNADRAGSALAALQGFAREREITNEPVDAIILDLLTNLFHLIDYLPAEACRYSGTAPQICPALSKLFTEAQENYQDEVSE